MPIENPKSKIENRRKPRLLIVGPLPPPFIGPAVATERLIASPIVRDAFDVELLDTSDPGGEEDIGRFTMHNVEEAIDQMRKFWRAIIRRRPDVLYISIARGFWGFLRDAMILVPARLLGVRTVIHLRAGRFDLIHDNGLPGRMLARLGLACVWRAAVLGETTRDIFGRFIDPRRVVVAPNGIDLASWPDPASPERTGIAGARMPGDPMPGDQMPGNAPGFEILYLANLFRDKGAHIMLEALARIVRELPDARVTFAGAWFDEEFRRHCMELVRRHGIEANVRFPGTVRGDEKRALLYACDLLVFAPVEPEGSPWVVLEAMAAGRAVVGTPQGTMKEVIVDGGTGYLVPPGDPGALADRILELARDRDLLRAMGRAARRRVEDVYAETKTHARLVEILSGIQNSKFKIQKAEELRPKT